MISLSDKNSRTAILTSLIFHSLLFLILALVKIGIDFNITEFIEITFVSGNDKSFAPSIPSDTRINPESLENQQEKPSDIVQLPPRNMQEIEEPSLKVIDKSKQIPTEEIKPIPTQEESNKEQETIDNRETAPTLGEKEIAVPMEGVSPDQKIIPGQSQSVDVIGDTPYQIEGQAARRTVISRVIPEYPENLQKEAIIKISFTVLPNGQVGEMIPTIKSDATLEKITLDALRQWRFNPLPSFEQQRSEKGIITFRYLLK
ncbi:MAG TPA: energy transducer TonB [bacterium]